MHFQFFQAKKNCPCWGYLFENFSFSTKPDLKLGLRVPSKGISSKTHLYNIHISHQSFMAPFFSSWISRSPVTSLKDFPRLPVSFESRDSLSQTTMKILLTTIACLYSQNMESFILSCMSHPLLFSCELNIW